MYLLWVILRNKGSRWWYVNPNYLYQIREPQAPDKNRSKLAHVFSPQAVPVANWLQPTDSNNCSQLTLTNCRTIRLSWKVNDLFGCTKEVHSYLVLTMNWNLLYIFQRSTQLQGKTEIICTAKGTFLVCFYLSHWHSEDIYGLCVCN